MAKRESEEEIYKFMDFLKFAMIIWVLFIHNYYDINEETKYTTFNVINELFSNVLSRIAVPVFFFISGYLFFFNVDFTSNIYLNKLKNRVRSLLVPYLFWNSLFIIFYFIIGKISFLSKWINGTDFSLSYVIKCFWCQYSDENLMYPICYQFWFIRDLMVIILLSPIIYFLVKNCRLFVLVVVLFWFFDYSIPYLGLRGLSSVCLCFFSLGSYFSLNRKNSFLNDITKVKILSLILYPIVIIVDFVSKDFSYNTYIHNLGILIGILFYFNLFKVLFDKYQLLRRASFSSLSFLIFAIHEPWILSKLKIVYIKLPHNEFYFVLCYFINILIVISLSYLLFKLLKKNTPLLLSFITGGRMS